MALLKMSRKPRDLRAAVLASGWPPLTMTTTPTPIYLSPVTAAIFSITIMATVRLPMSQRRPALVGLGGQPELHGLVTTATAGSNFFWVALLNGILSSALPSSVMLR